MKPPKASKEQQILFNLLKEAPPLSLDGIDTSSLFSLFCRHRLLPLAGSITPLLDESEKEQWQQAIRQESMKSLGHVARLIHILDQFEAGGIEALPLKGPVLAQSLYGDVSQRHMRDLDLLVKPDELIRSLDILKHMGYALKLPGKELTPEQWRRYLKQQYDVILVHREDGSLLELHTRIAYPELLGWGEQLIIQESENMELAGRTINCMSREGTILYLAIHGTHHLFFRLFWLRDLSVALKRWGLDHAKIAGIAEQMGIERMLGVGLRLTERFFGNSIPAEYFPLLKAQEAIVDRMEARSYRAICELRFYGRRSRMNVFCFYMDLKKGWRHKWNTLSSVFHRWRIRRMVSG